MSKHRADARPRWGRIGLLTAAMGVTLIAVLAGFGIFSGSPDRSVATDPAAAAASLPKSAVSAVPTASPSASPSSAASSDAGSASAGSSAASGSSSSSAPAVSADADTALPAGSGTGKRAVFSQTEQRVWIVGSDGTVERTYPVSGSDEDNLVAGTYHVYGKSRWAVGIDDSGVMQYFVRFAHGTDNGASIGFHSIPTKGGKPLQTVAQLGQRLSHGCIRQKTDDAIAMWDFASVGTEVVVVA
ncbi:L,D-transpeptidase [Nocardioides sp. Iso805N]|uniref:L,D-transpeptidase n=1 Tax=Nocardioides sp. Iso805N TaxID=1283287 RepID=UPI00035EDBF7|nr:L,D-transpeptidase [Nocardioides sp. Iso805N]